MSFVSTSINAVKFDMIEYLKEDKRAAEIHQPEDP